MFWEIQHELTILTLNSRFKISLDETVTTKGQQAGTWMRTTADLVEYDGVMVVGGDGLFHEVVNGMLQRTDGFRVPLGIIPSGIPLT